MKLHRVFLIALLTSVFAVVGCGGGGGDASNACSSCPEARREVCEIDYNDCIQVGGTQENCENAVRADCLL
jgi:hypothetical protein